MKDLQEKREELQKKLDRMEAAHVKRFNQLISSEGAYRDSCKVNHLIYLELFKVCEELGDPIPVRI
tara:strand:- start:455 stop:652 length:198 start_codon:yes stop_codon:yes gene_type:complete